MDTGKEIMIRVVATVVAFLIIAALVYMFEDMKMKQSSGCGCGCGGHKPPAKPATDPEVPGTQTTEGFFTALNMFSTPWAQ